MKDDEKKIIEYTLENPEITIINLIKLSGLNRYKVCLYLDRNFYKIARVLDQELREDLGVDIVIPGFLKTNERNKLLYHNKISKYLYLKNDFLTDKNMEDIRFLEKNMM